MLSNGHSVTDPAKIKKQRARASKALSNAIQRCTNKNNPKYANYGGMGIQVLIGLDELIAILGLPKEDVSLDRINPNGHYEAGNVRWATKAVQAANKKSSPGGSTLSVASLINQQKAILEQEKRRPKVTEAWWLLLKAFNFGCVSISEGATFRDNLNIDGSGEEVFGSREVIIEGVAQVIFSLPSLTMPDAVVDARGPRKASPEEEVARRLLRQGLLWRLRQLEATANLPDLVYTAINNLITKKDCRGLTLLGRPTKIDLTSGWFEVWMLAAASRLSEFGLYTALFPALTCLDLLDDFGGPHNWDDVSHPILRAKLLFIPDFQLDCGPWGNLTNYQFGKIERLLQYRLDYGLKTVVGIQNAHKLGPALRKLLLAEYKVQQVPNKVPLVSDIKFATKPMNPAQVDTTESHNSADDFEECEGA